MGAGKKIVDKCVNCSGDFRKFSRSHFDKKEPYKGNMICYKTSEHKHYKSMGGPYDPVTYGDYTHSTYSYVLWDGETYRTTAGSMYFCSGKCEKEFGSDCARASIRRIGAALVRFNKGDRRAG